MPLDEDVVFYVRETPYGFLEVGALDSPGLPVVGVMAEKYPNTIYFYPEISPEPCPYLVVAVLDQNTNQPWHPKLRPVKIFEEPDDPRALQYFYQEVERDMIPNRAGETMIYFYIEAASV